MIEYGVWSEIEDGFIERGYWSYDAARLAIAEQYADEDEDEDEVTARQLCNEHRDEEQPQEGCELCYAEDEED